MKVAAISGFAAALFVGFTASPAFAGENSDLSTAEGDGCAVGAEGRFIADGDKFYISDECKDGYAGVLLVDKKPFSSARWGHDFKVWATGGSGTSNTEIHNLPEGTPLYITACVGKKSTGEFILCDNLLRWGKA
jgi:hypothetical protein